MTNTHCNHCGAQLDSTTPYYVSQRGFCSWECHDDATGERPDEGCVGCGGAIVAGDRCLDCYQRHQDEPTPDGDDDYPSDGWDNPIEQGMYDDDPNPYDGTYSEE